jgi:hypothetical protein
MSLLRLLNMQGMAGLAVGIALAVLLLVQWGETRHWKNESARFELLYREEHAAHAGTIATMRAAAEAARASDQANLARVAAEQRAINERTLDDYEARLAAARALAERLRGQTAVAASGSGIRRDAAVPGLSAPASGASEAAGQDGFPDSDRLIATEQAIQLEELIEWVRQQQMIDQAGRAPPIDTPSQ